MKDPWDPLEIATLYGNSPSVGLLFLDIFDKQSEAHHQLPLVRQMNAAIKAPMLVMVKRGSISSLDDIEPYLEAGAQYFILNNSAVERPEVVSEAVARYGSAELRVALPLNGFLLGAGSIVSELTEPAPG